MIEKKNDDKGKRMNGNKKYVRIQGKSEYKNIRAKMKGQNMQNTEAKEKIFIKRGTNVYF